jgi:hypothetical protein
MGRGGKVQSGTPYPIKIMSSATHRQNFASQAHRLSLPRRMARRKPETIRGYIPLSIEPHDSPREIVDVFGVSYGTACVWLRILRGPVKRN